MSFHPTRREILLVIILTVILGLFLQFDLSLRFTDSSGSDSLLGFKVGFGRGRDEWYDREGGREGGWLEDEEDDIKVSKGKELTSMSDAKQRWGNEGPARTEVMAHAPGQCRPVPRSEPHC